MPSNIRKLIQRNFGAKVVCAFLCVFFPFMLFIAKILNIIRTKWPDAEITYEDDDNVPSC